MSRIPVTPSNPGDDDFLSLGQQGSGLTVGFAVSRSSNDTLNLGGNVRKSITCLYDVHRSTRLRGYRLYKKTGDNNTMKSEE